MWSKKSHNLPLQILKVIIYNYLSHNLALRMKLLLTLSSHILCLAFFVLQRERAYTNIAWMEFFCLSGANLLELDYQV